MKLVHRFAFLAMTSMSAVVSAQPTTEPSATKSKSGETVETIVFLRHAEKPMDDLGNLTPQGLNRAIALAKVLPAKYGKPDYIFAPDPAITKVSKDGKSYFYVRPLMTIEPTAIAMEMPVQTAFGFSQIEKLNAELTLPNYANTTIFIAWEHWFEEQAAGKLLQQFGANAAIVPTWGSSDFDSLYVIRITRTPGRPATATFMHDHEGLNQQSTQFPEPAPATRPAN